MHILIILAHTVILTFRWAKSVDFDLQLFSEHHWAREASKFCTPPHRGSWAELLFMKKGQGGQKSIFFTSITTSILGDRSQYIFFNGTALTMNQKWINAQTTTYRSLSLWSCVFFWHLRVGVPCDLEPQFFAWTLLRGLSKKAFFCFQFFFLSSYGHFFTFL